MVEGKNILVLKLGKTEFIVVMGLREGCPQICKSGIF